MKIKFPKTFPTLETERLVLRTLTADDKEGVFQNFSDADVTQYLMPPLTKMSQAESFINAFVEEFEQGSALTWAIALKADSVFLGTCSCEIKSAARAELGFDLSRTHWGQGLMSEALRAVLQFGFEKLELNQIKAHTFLLNHRTIHLLTRLNFQVDGVLRENSFVDGKYHDEIFFSVWKNNWLRQQEKPR